MPRTQMLERFLEQENAMRNLFGKHKPLTATKEDSETIFQILENKLSPENLSCDGELPRSQVIARERLYTGAWKEMETIAGVKREPVI